MKLDGGEVCLRSPFLMDGYFDNPEATAEALRDGWYHTGDLGALDDEGYLSIVGRARDVIRTGGETVAPAEVEAVLGDAPDVAEVAVVGVPDPAWGEVVSAVVVLRARRRPPLDLDDAPRRTATAASPPFKQPRRLEIVDALPRTAATGQVQRTLLVERLQARSVPEHVGAAMDHCDECGFDYDELPEQQIGPRAARARPAVRHGARERPRAAPRASRSSGVWSASHACIATPARYGGSSRVDG